MTDMKKGATWAATQTVLIGTTSSGSEINDAVVKEMAKPESASKCFPTVALDAKLTEVSIEVINFHDWGISGGAAPERV